MHDWRARFLKNHDGDTVTMFLDRDFYEYKQINIRLANVWAPDGDQEGVRETKEYVNNWFADHTMFDPDAWNFMVFTHYNKYGFSTKTFDRYVADVYSLDMKHHLNSDIMKFILDRGYLGGIGSIVRAI